MLVGWRSVLLAALQACAAASDNSCAGDPWPHLEHFNSQLTAPFSGCDLSTASPSVQLCSPDAADPALRCPAACAAPMPSPLEAKRVRKALHTLSADEWRKIVDALWVMRSVSTERGVEIYGPSYRSYDFFVYRHALASDPPFDPAHACQDGVCLQGDVGADTTGGGAQQLIWHGLSILEFETTLLAVDPTIPGMPYIDWPRSIEAEQWEELFGAPTCEGDSYIDGESCVLDKGPFGWWPVHVTTTEKEWSANIAAEPLLDAIGRWLFAPLEADHEADAPLPMHNASQAWSVLYAKFVDGTAGGHTRTDASDMSTLLMDMPWLVRGAQSRFPTGADKAKLAAAMDREISFCLDAVNAASGARWLEIAACYEGRLTRNEMSLHSEFHTNALGGDAALARPNVDPTVDPLTFFHHTAGDRLRAQWQYRQRELRPIAYGYPVQDGYNLTRSGLYDCVGCDAYGLGFDMQGLQGLQAGQYLGSATAADMLCSGEFELLYTCAVGAHSVAP